jgi:hypothetical protein
MIVLPPLKRTLTVPEDSFVSALGILFVWLLLSMPLTAPNYSAPNVNSAEVLLGSVKFYLCNKVKS